MERMTAAEYRARGAKAGKRKDTRPWNQRYDSKAEEAFANSGWRQFALYLQVYPSLVANVEHHAETQHLAGQRYTPDFRVVLPFASSRCYVEVKQTKYQPSYRDSRSKIRAAKATYPHDRYFVAWYEKGSWRFEEIN